MAPIQSNLKQQQSSGICGYYTRSVLGLIFDNFIGQTQTIQTPQMKLTLAHKQKRLQSEELIDLSCRSHLAWINSNTHDVKYLITEVCKRNALPYNVPLGSLCAHVAKHYSPDQLRYRYADLFTTEKIINKFHLVFQGNCQPIKKESNSQQMLNTMEKLVNYGRVCLVLTMKLDFKQSIPNLKEFDQQLKTIIKRLLSSMLFQFIPSEYSELLLKLYLQDFQTEQERQWMQQNKKKHEDIVPYHDFFQILASLSYHILNTRKAINCQHYLEILANPATGCVQWPMVLGVRNLHRLPLPES